MRPGNKFTSFSGAVVLALEALGVTSVYTPLLSERFHGALGSGFTIVEMTVPMPSVAGSSAEWLSRFAGMPVELLRTARTQPPTKSSKIDRDAFPAGTLFVPIEVTTGSALTTRGQWLAFSTPIMSKDQLDALVFYRAECGGLCGEEGYAWLRRSSRQVRWSVAKKVTRRLS